MTDKSIFQRPLWVSIFALTVTIVGDGCFCLGETFYRKYAIAGALATTGIYIINKGKK